MCGIMCDTTSKKDSIRQKKYVNSDKITLLEDASNQ